MREAVGQAELPREPSPGVPVMSGFLLCGEKGCLGEGLREGPAQKSKVPDFQREAGDFCVSRSVRRPGEGLAQSGG